MIKVNLIKTNDIVTGLQVTGHAKSANGGWNAGKRQELLDRRRFQRN